MDPQLEAELQLWFGTVSKTMLSLYMAVSGGDDWHNFYDILQQVGTRAALVFLIFILFFQIALVNILTGVFVENAMELAEPDRAETALRNRKKHIAEENSLGEICREEIDKDCSGGISKSKFYEAYDKRDSKLKDHLNVLGLNIHDVEMFFKLLSLGDQEQEVDIDSFVACCLRLKGAASSLELQQVEFQIKYLYKKQKQFHDACMRKLEGFGRMWLDGSNDKRWRDCSRMSHSSPVGRQCNTQSAAASTTKGLSILEQSAQQDRKRAFIRSALLCSSCPRMSAATTSFHRLIT